MTPRLAIPLLVTLAAAGCDKKESGAPAATASAAAADKPADKPAGDAEKPKSTRNGMRRLIGSERCDAETKYVDCVVKACADTYKKCYGDDVEKGTYAGPCQDLGACVSACSEGDAGCGMACLDKHKTDGSACDKCADGFGDCMTKGSCTPPTDGCK